MEAGTDCCQSLSLIILSNLNFPFVGCGDVADEANNGGVVAPETDCATPCTGDPIHVRFVLARATLKRILICKEYWLNLDTVLWGK
jgi:hypothetical protein